MNRGINQRLYLDGSLNKIKESTTVQLSPPRLAICYEIRTPALLFELYINNAIEIKYYEIKHAHIEPQSLFYQLHYTSIQ